MKTGSITYNGTNSLELGVYTTGSGSFDAAELDVDKYEVAGRNGDVIIPKNRYKNIEVIYPAFIPKQFSDKVQSVRNWLRSAKVYSRLEDTYDMDHFRLGLASGVQSFEPVNRNDGANFEMTFDCKPQRFLKVGETPETVEAETKTASGEIASFDSIAVVPMTSAEVSLSPIQDLNGYDSPWPGGGGKNKFDVSKMVNTADITVSNGAITVSGNAKSSTKKLSELADLVVGSTYTVTATVTGGQSTLIYLYGSNFSWTYGTQRTITQQDLDSLVMFYGGSGQTAVITEMMIRLASESDATFAPYSNICPISGHTGAELNIGSTYPTAVNTYSVTFTDQGTVYGGTFDFVSGKLKVTHKLVELDATWYWYKGGTQPDGKSVISTTGFPAHVYNQLDEGRCSHFKKASTIYIVDMTEGTFMLAPNGTGGYFCMPTADYTASDFKDYITAQKNAGTPITVYYELATPVEYTLSAQQIETLLGENNVWSDAGEITVEYAEPYNVENPTQYEARPLFIITNPEQGDVLSVSGVSITFVDSYTGTVTIDCETMDCYAGFSNMNYLIEATDFPVLGEGTSIVTWSGSGECKMIPRWWEL